MKDSELLWEGKSKKCHFSVDDFWGIILALWTLGMQVYIFMDWRGGIEEYIISFVLMIIIFYEGIGKFIIRIYYVKRVCYKLYADKLVIDLKIKNKNYLREFYVEDISSVAMKKYKTGLGSIHFGDAETKYWDRWKGQYKGSKDNIVVTTIGLLRKRDKWNSGIIYNIEQVEKVYALLGTLRQNY